MTRINAIKGLCHMAIQQLQLVMGDVDLKRWDAAHEASKELGRIAVSLEEEVARLRRQKEKANGKEKD